MLIHDFWLNRKFPNILDYFIVISQSQTLKKNDLDDDKERDWKYVEVKYYRVKFSNYYIV